MKIIAIGDIHGRSIWANIVAKEELSTDKIIFVGDYFDTFAKIPADLQIENFEMILEYKRTFPDKVVMLLGNHDFHYLKVGETYNGYQVAHAEEIGKVVADAVNSGDMVIAHREGEYLFTHAGVTKTWCDMHGIDPNNIVEEANLMLEHNRDAFRFYRPDSSGYGENIHQSPIWVRPTSLVQDAIPDVIQIVGHTEPKGGMDIAPGDTVVLIDTLGVKEYLIIEDGVASIGKI